MAIRKEQVLCLLAFGAALLYAPAWLEQPALAGRFAPTKVGYEAPALPVTPLLTDAATPARRADFCTEPSETRPLPPRTLAFPPRAPLSLAGLPLDPGPDFRHLWLVRLDGTQLVDQPLTVAGESTPVASPPEPAAGNGTGQVSREEQAARTYDRIWIAGLAAPFYGTIERGEHDLFALEAGGPFDGVVLRMRRFRLNDQRFGGVETFGGDKQRIERIALAGTLQNEIARRVRAVPEQPIAQPQRRELVEWLLERARESAAVYDEALRQAEIYRQLALGDLDGLRLVQRVLRARGDLAGELALLEGLPASGAQAAFRYEGLGVIKSRLGLWADAEADLRQAVALGPDDARPHAALAEFLRQRGRSREAHAVARRTAALLEGVSDLAERARLGGVVVACQLGVGEVDAAQRQLQRLSSGPAMPYLEGCVHYARGDTGAAMAAFRRAGGGPDSGAALLGQAACLGRDGALQEAHDLLLRVYDQEPLLRHRAATGLAQLFVRTSQFDAALSWIDRALEAEPQDPYAYYLRGRALRLLGQLATAEEALTEALRRRDDFVHAIAEMAAVRAARAREGVGTEQAAAAVAARRYADRAVELVPTPSQELLELQGLHAFGAGDPRGAGAAFARARDLAADERQKWYGKGAIAVVDYSRGLVDDAATALQRMVQDLGRDEPIAKWAAATLAAIDDHAQKESLGDGFDRAELGATWAGDSDGPLGPRIEDGQLVFRGRFSRTGRGEVSAVRTGAVNKGKNFLAVQAVLRLGPQQPGVDAFAGLGIEIQRGSGGVECQVRVGVRDGRPFVLVQDGREGGQENVVRTPLDLPGFQPAGPHPLELRVVPRGDEQSRQFALQVAWNGIVVHRADLKTLTGNTNTELKTVLFASGNKGSDVDVRFDDYRLERRKER